MERRKIVKGWDGIAFVLSSTARAVRERVRRELDRDRRDPLSEIIRQDPTTEAVWAYIDELQAFLDSQPLASDLMRARREREA